MGESSEAPAQRPDLKIIQGGKEEPKEISRIWEHIPNHPSNPIRQTPDNVVPLHKK